MLESRLRTARRRAAREDDLPAVPSGSRLRDDAGDLGRVDALLGDAHGAAIVRGQRPSLARALRALEHPRVRLARVGEGLALAVLDVEEPLLRPRLAKADGGALAVVEDVRGLVDDEVGEGVVLGEVVGRDVAGRVLASSRVGAAFLPEPPLIPRRSSRRRKRAGFSTSTCSARLRCRSLWNALSKRPSATQRGSTPSSGGR